MQIAPAYIAVTARHTLQRKPIPAPPPPKPAAKIDWSPAVRAYVQRAFAAEDVKPSVDRAAMQEKLKLVISQAAEEGLLEAIDWSTYPLPQEFLAQERAQTASQAANSLPHTNNKSFNAPRTTPSEEPPFSGIPNRKKRKSSEMDPADIEQSNLPPWKRKSGKNALEDRITGRTNGHDKKQSKSTVPNAADKDMDAFQKRRQRFGNLTPDPSPYVSRGESPSEVSSGPLVGTCQTLEKNYFRLTAPPPPSAVRPLPVLEQALDLIRKKWKKEHNYTYACDQLKSLRQDLTVQHIKNEFTVKVYEVHARIALEMADLGEYNQCQTQLRTLYKLNLGNGGRPEEFTAYRILYFIYTCNRTDMNNVLADLTPADKQKPGVQHALQVRSALASGNYHKFFRLYDEAPFMGPYLLDMFVQRERLAAMAAICKTYKPDVSVRFLASELAFHGGNDDDPNDVDAGPRQCLEFLCQSSGEHLVERKGDEVRFLTGKAGALFENARAAAFGKVDIKGQI